MQTSNGYVPDCLIRPPAPGLTVHVEIGERSHRATVVSVDGERARVRLDNGTEFGTRTADLLHAQGEMWGKVQGNGEAFDGDW